MPIEFSETILQNDDFKVETDGNGDLVQTHKQTGATFKFDSAKNAWVPVEGLDLQSADISNVGALDAEEADITNETLIKAHLGSAQSINLGTFAQLNIGTADKDERNEVDTSNNKIVPDKTGWYHIVISVVFDNASDGDQLTIRLRDVSAGSNLTQTDINSSGSNREAVSLVATPWQLTGGNDHIIEVRNNSSSDTINSADARTFITIRWANR